MLRAELPAPLDVSRVARTDHAGDRGAWGSVAATGNLRGGVASPRANAEVTGRARRRQAEHLDGANRRSPWRRLGRDD